MTNNKRNDQSFRPERLGSFSGIGALIQALLRKAQSTRTAKFDPQTLSRMCSRKCRREGGNLPTSEVRTDADTQKLLGSNFSKKPPVLIDGVSEGEEGEGQGRLWGGGVSCCDAEFNCTVGSQHWPIFQAPRERGSSPGEGHRQGAERPGKGTRSPERRAPNLKPLSTTEEVKCVNCPAYNWTSRINCRRHDLELLFQDRQFGIGTPQGRLAMTVSIRARLEENPHL